MQVKPIVYIASPYTKGDPAINVRTQCLVFNTLMNSGLVWPVAPLWSHFQHIMFPRPYRDWTDYDLAMISRYDACLRVHSSYSPMGYAENKSPGADEEVAEFKRTGKPVFYTLEDLYKWARDWTKRRTYPRP